MLNTCELAKRDQHYWWKDISGTVKEAQRKSSSGNFEITMNGFKISKQEISKLKSILNFMEDVLEKKVEKLQEGMKDIDGRVQGIYKYQVDPN